MMGLERIGARLYITGDSFAIKDRLKAAGCHWDSDRRQWWIGMAKAPEIEALTMAAAALPPAAAAAAAGVPDSARVYARAEYKGRSYYVVAEAQDGARLRLSTLDGSVNFWADGPACTIIKRYQAREHRGRTEYQTLGKIRQFIARQSDPATRQGECTECGHWGPSGQPCSECGGEGTHQ